MNRIGILRRLLYDIVRTLFGESQTNESLISNNFP